MRLRFLPVLALACGQLHAAGVLDVRAPGHDFRNAEYSTSHVFIDEVAATTADIEIRFDLTGFNNITDVEVFTNLNRRQLARIDKDGDGYADGIHPVDGNTITDSAADTDPASGHYYIPVNMSEGSTARVYELTIPAGSTGAYRLTARFKSADAIAENDHDPDTWIWHGLRDHAIVVSPVDARNIRLYEINVFNIEASGDSFAQRSTFEDLHNAPGGAHNASNRWDLGYLKALGMNWLWFQPIHPNGIDGREPSDGWGGSAPPYDPGSPYAVKNFFEVNELMSINYSGSNSTTQNRAASMAAFQSFVTSADAEDVGIMLDSPFNHTAFDVELAQQGVDLFQRDGESWSPLDEIRNRDARFFSLDGNYGNRASSAANIAPGPDRFDFGKWNDVKDVFFGRYDALVEIDSEPERSSYTNEGDWFDINDADWTSNDFTQGGQQWNLTRRAWDYFAEYAIHWLDKTRPAGQNRNSAPADGDATARYAWDQAGIDGLRCDFGQGLPPRCWEYIINVARGYKWNFVMMSESLDGGAVTYRSNRHFDILNENIVFPLASATDKLAYQTIFEERRSAYGQGLVLLNNTSHDEANFTDPWQAVVRSGVTGMIDGATMIFPGQELGISETYGYDHYELNFGKNIPHFKRWNSMQPIWSNSDFGNDQLFPVYAGIQSARASSPALRSSNRWFLNGDGNNSQIFAAAKYEEANASPAIRDVVLAFANIDRDNNQSDDFKIPAELAPLLGIQDSRSYNVKNIAAYTAQDPTRRDLWLWGSGVSGADLKSGGFTVFMKEVPTTEAGWSTAPYEAQYLKLHDITSPAATPTQPTMPNAFAYAIGDSVTFDWDDVAADAAGVVPSYEVTVTINGNPAGTFITAGSDYSVTAAEGDSVSISVKAVNPDFNGNAGPPSTASETVSLLNATADEDHDGQSNGDEDTAGTNPFDRSSVFRATGIELVASTVEITFSSVPGRVYTLQSSTNLWDWDDEDEPDLVDYVAQPGETMLTFTDISPGDAKKFYRVLVKKPAP